MRGQFVRGDGLIIPNNISTAGAQMILAGAFQGVAPTLYAALVDGFPSPGMTSAQMTEPTIGANGYGRISVAPGVGNWPTLSSAGGEAFVETGWLTWTATNNFDQTVNRVALIGTNAYHATDSIFCLSSPFAPILIGPSTPLAQRQFKYQVFI